MHNRAQLILKLKSLITDPMINAMEMIVIKQWLISSTEKTSKSFTWAISVSMQGLAQLKKTQRLSKIESKQAEKNLNPAPTEPRPRLSIKSLP
jgi:negative regulator of sigma E activity